MKHSHAAPLTGTLLFRKGGPGPADILVSHSGGSIGGFGGASMRPSRRDPNAPVRVSVQLDRARRQHLQLAAAKLGISNRELLISALDHYLRNEVPAQIADPCSCLKPMRSEAV